MGAGRPASSPLPRPWPRGGSSLASVSRPGKLQFDAWSQRLRLGVPRPTLGCLCQCPPSLCTAGPGRSREAQPRISLTRGLAASSKQQGGSGLLPTPGGPAISSGSTPPIRPNSNQYRPPPLFLDRQHSLLFWLQIAAKNIGGGVLYSKFSLSWPPLGPCKVRG